MLKLATSQGNTSGANALKRGAGVTRQYYPKRDRGLHRAAANPNSTLHGWATRLLKDRSTFSGMLKMLYRERGYRSLADLVYKENPFLALLKRRK